MAKLHSRENKCYATSEELEITMVRMEKKNFRDDAELDGEAMFNEIQRRNYR